MRPETQKLLRKLETGGFRIINTREWVTTSGKKRLTVTVTYPDGQEVTNCYVLKMGTYVLV